MELLETVVKSWWFALLLGVGCGMLIALILVARDNTLVRLREGLVVTEKKYIDGLNMQIERLMEEIRNIG